MARWMPSASKALQAPAEETTFSSIIIEPKSLAPQCRAICAVALPTVSHEACMLRMLWSTMRLTAMRRRYSSGEKRERTPLLFEPGTLAAEYPRDEGDETVVALRAFGLQVAQQQQVFDALGGCLHMAVHHGSRGGQVYPVGFAHHFAPLCDGGFAG